MASTIHTLNWLQRGRTYFNIASRLDGSTGYTLEELAQKYGLNIRESDRNNRVVIQGSVAVVQAQAGYNANQFETDMAAAYPELSVTFDHSSLGTTTTTTSTTTTSTTTTTTTTTTT